MVTPYTKQAKKHHYWYRNLWISQCQQTLGQRLWIYIYIYCLNSWVRIAKLPSFHLLPMWPSPSLDLESFSCLYQSFSHSSFAVKEILYQNVRICMTFRFFPTSKKRKGMNSIRNQWGCKAFQQIGCCLFSY